MPSRLGSEPPAPPNCALQQTALRAAAECGVRTLMHVAIQFAALVGITLIAFIVYAYVQGFVAVNFFPFTSPRPVFEMIVCAVAGSFAAAAVSSIPLAKLFKRHAWLAALLVALPVVTLRLNDLWSYSGTLRRDVEIMAVIESGSYLLVLVGGAILFSRFRLHSNFSSKPTP